ncbi:MAG TPA: hypothetical protein VF941_11610 [Clostridia bacterium]
MNVTLVLCSLAVFILLIVYISARKSDIYADKININICKLLNIEITNKVKSSGTNANPPEQLKH